MTAQTTDITSFIGLSPLPMALLDGAGGILECNREFAALLGIRQAVAVGRVLPDFLLPPSQLECLSALSKPAAPEASARPLHWELQQGASEKRSATFYLTPLDANEAPSFLVHAIDTTEQKNLETRFAHSQKMQAVGQLAGGIAHDFNNLLTAMIGFCDLLLMRHPAGDQSFADIMQIKQNANRAANLVRQLLAFSRRQTLQPKVLDITDVLAELSNLVRRLIGENIELNMVHGRDLGLVRVDQGQFEQVVINLAVNARDAMKNGGALTVKTHNVTVDRQNPLPGGLIAPTGDDAIIPGDYVLCEIADTGTGIPHEIIQKIFEPFFSTKELGAGTGLGLATVYGIVKQTGGYIYVASKAGAGTTFYLYFPRAQDSAATAPVQDAASVDRMENRDLTGRNTILLVEDETPVRIFAGRALRNKGYTVLEADSAETAMEVMAEKGDEVELIVTDVIMPGQTGPQMIAQLMPAYPNIRVIFISGYAEDAFVDAFGETREFNFLPKPFTLKQLASKVKEVLGGE